MSWSNFDRRAMTRWMLGLFQIMAPSTCSASLFAAQAST